MPVRTKSYNSVQDILKVICGLFVAHKVVQQCEVVHDFGDRLLNFGGEYGGIQDGETSRIYLKVDNKLKYNATKVESSTRYDISEYTELAQVRAVFLLSTDLLTPEERTGFNFIMANYLRHNILALQSNIEAIKLRLIDIETDKEQILRDEIPDMQEDIPFINANIVAADFSIEYKIAHNRCFIPCFSYHKGECLIQIEPPKCVGCHGTV